MGNKTWTCQGKTWTENNLEKWSKDFHKISDKFLKIETVLTSMSTTSWLIFKISSISWNVWRILRKSVSTSSLSILLMSCCCRKICQDIAASREGAKRISSIEIPRSTLIICKSSTIRCTLTLLISNTFSTKSSSLRNSKAKLKKEKLPKSVSIRSSRLERLIGSSILIWWRKSMKNLLGKWRRVWKRNSWPTPTA